MLGQYDEALSHYNYGIEKNNQSVELFYNRGLAFVSKEMYQQGIDDFNKALSIQTPNQTTGFKILLNLGINLRRVGKLDESIAKLKAAIELQPDKAQAWNNLGLSLFEQEDSWDESLTAYSKAIQIE